MYASYLQVHFNPGKKSAAIQLLNDEIIPQVKQAPGFVRGIWVGNEELGSLFVKTPLGSPIVDREHSYFLWCRTSPR